MALADNKAKIQALIAGINALPNAGGGGGGSAIVDVVSLPEDDINKNVIYRLVTATFVVGKTLLDEFVCECVNELPEVGEPATNFTMDEIHMYYSVADKLVSGYITAELSAGLGVPVGWYPADVLFQVAGIAYGGVVTSIKDCSVEESMYVLISHEFYTDAGGLKPIRPDWNENNPASPAYIKNRPFYKEDPPFEIVWDGDTSGRFMLPLDALGAPGSYLVRVSDDIFDLDRAGNSTLYSNFHDERYLEYRDLNENIPGVVVHDDALFASVHDSSLVSAALGVGVEIPTGTYFLYSPENDFKIVRMEGYRGVIEIPDEYFNLRDKLSPVAFSGNYNDLWNTPNTPTNVYTKSEVDAAISKAISTAITGAIGGAY